MSIFISISVYISINIYLNIYIYLYISISWQPPWRRRVEGCRGWVMLGGDGEGGAGFLGLAESSVLLGVRWARQDIYIYTYMGGSRCAWLSALCAGGWVL